MICDIENCHTYNNYRSKKGPFLITFYHEDIYKINFYLYSNLKFFERKYNDIPIIRFSYNDFLNKFPLENIESPNHLVVLENCYKKTIYDTVDKNVIENILIAIRRKRMMYKKMFNKEFKCGRKNTLRPWTTNCNKIKQNEIYYYLNMTAEIQYKFPNITASMPLNSNCILNSISSDKNIVLVSKDKNPLPKSKFMPISKQSNIQNRKNQKLFKHNNKTLNSLKLQVKSNKINNESNFLKLETEVNLPTKNKYFFLRKQKKNSDSINSSYNLHNLTKPSNKILSDIVKLDHNYEKSSISANSNEKINIIYLNNKKIRDSRKKISDDYKLGKKSLFSQIDHLVRNKKNLRSINKKIEKLNSDLFKYKNVKKNEKLDKNEIILSNFDKNYTIDVDFNQTKKTILSETESTYGTFNNFYHEDKETKRISTDFNELYLDQLLTQSERDSYYNLKDFSKI